MNCCACDNHVSPTPGKGKGIITPLIHTIIIVTDFTSLQYNPEPKSNPNFNPNLKFDPGPDLEPDPDLEPNPDPTLTQPWPYLLLQ